MKNPIKISWPNLPRLNLRLPKLRLPGFRLPALRGIQLPAVRTPFVNRFQGSRFFLGVGVAVVAGLGALGWFVIWPALNAPQAAAAASESAPVQHAAGAPEGAAKSAANEPSQAQSARLADGPESARTAQGDTAVPPELPAASQQAGGAAASQAKSEPETLVRKLQDMQERVAAGDAEAIAELPRLLRATAQNFTAQPPETWRQKQNARALALYLLSGGNSAIGRKILSARAFAPSEEALTKGAIAYLDGIDCPERDALLGLDPRALDAALGAQLAFVQSILLANVDRQKAIATLDVARLLAPGGLVEEAALRREIGLLGETTDFAKFAGLSRQYWARFRRSPYAENFLRQFMGAVARVSALVKIEEWADLEEFINSLAPETRRALYLVMAKTAAVAGNSAFAFLAAQRAMELSAPDSVERQRAQLYRAAARVGEADAAQNPFLLRDIERAWLPAADQPLYDATALVSARLFRAPERDSAAAADAAGDGVPAAALAQAETSLKDANSALEGARQSMERQRR
jgi:chemotaxis protein MotC